MFVGIALIASVFPLLVPRSITDPVTVIPGRSMTLDLDRQPDGIQIHQLFHVQNPGDTNLRILNVQTGCGCTSIQQLPPEMAPHKTYPAYIDVDVGPHLTGDHAFWALIRFSDGRLSRIALKMNLVNRMQTDVDLGWHLQGTFPTQVIRVLPNRSGEKLRVNNVDCDAKFFKVSFHNAADVNDATTIEVGLQANVSQGPFSKYLQVAIGSHFNPSDSENISNISVHVHGWVARSVETEQKDIDFGTLVGSATVRREVNLYSPYGKPFKFGRLESEISGALSVETISDSPDHLSCKIAVALNPQAVHSFQVFRANLFVSCNGAEEIVPIDVYAGRL